ncbi:MAG: hypothetical protein IPK03_09140, partial [Bacteroidetes bacterium]|nr:hypothetical protein [Bacteroidota bacterium]
GIQTQYHDSMTITGNVITSNTPAGGYSGIYMYWSQRAPVLTKNKIIYTSTSGIVLLVSTEFNCLSSMNKSNPLRGLIANNMIQVSGTTSTAYGLYMVNSSNYVDIMHNTISMNNTANGGSYALYLGNGLSNLNVKNNIFQNTGNGTATGSGYAAFLYNGSTIVYTNNDFFTRHTNFGYYNGGLYSTYATWKAAATVGIPSFEIGGLNKEVTFVSPTDIGIRPHLLYRRC